MEKILTPDEVASRLSISLKTVGNLLRSTQLKGVRVGRLWRIPERELERYLGLDRRAEPVAAGGVKLES